MKSNFVSPAEEYLKLAQEKYTEQDYQAALSNLRWGFVKDNSHKPLYKLALDILKQLDATDEKKLFENALLNFSDFQPFFDLGYHFIDVGGYEMAQPFLERALSINPQNTDAAYELSLAYTSRFNVQKGLEVLSKVDLSQDFWATYRFHLCKLWNNQVDDIQDFISEAQAWLKSHEDNEDTQFVWEKIEELDEALMRYNLINDLQPHIRDWHFVQYGTAILDYFEESDQYVAGGRYVALWGSMESVRGILEVLKILLQKMHRNPTKIISMQDRDSEIIAIAMSKLLDIPFEFLNEANLSEENTLIIAGDNENFNGFEQIIPLQKEQTVFSLYLNWLVGAMISPDIAGFMAQTYFFPWQGGNFRVVDTASQKIEKTLPDTRSAEEIADDLVIAEPEMSQVFNETLDFYEKFITYLKGRENGGKKRLSFAVDSPVPGSYFG